MIIASFNKFCNKCLFKLVLSIYMGCLTSQILAKDHRKIWIWSDMECVNNMWSVLGSQAGITSEQFWTAVGIWHKNPHFVCKRLCGSITLFVGKIKNSSLNEFQSKLETIHNFDEFLDSKEISTVFRRHGIEVEEVENNTVEEDVDVLLTLKKLIPRNSEKYQHCTELAILDKRFGSAIFKLLARSNEANDLPLATYPCVYKMELVEESMQLCLLTDSVQSERKTLYIGWLEKVLFPKLVKWAKHADSVCSAKVIRSLSMVSIDTYVSLYERLKTKYGKEMVKIWPEKTDPAKFVYEDVAIATYLLLIWEQERLEKGKPDWKQSFVDLGCGNGLLVYILSSEGHRGLGLDVRKRGIWDMYPDTTKLEICAIDPFDGSSYADYDWLIGNHSDELTPWIPVLASRSSYDCSFFLLPCCFYDFAGNKYQRKDTSRSQYEEYLDFVRQVCEKCGFRTQIDKLRIPSTKRTCLIGSARTYPKEDVSNYETIINSMIQERCKGKIPFKPRESEEKVRNCTRLKEGVIELVLQIVLGKLLDETDRDISRKRKWNAGRKLELKELAEAIPKETRMELKNECGGLQTLLRNKRHLFVVSKGLVFLRDPLAPELNDGNNRQPKIRKTGNSKVTPAKKRCWFLDHHPDGCPSLPGDCLFEH